MNSNGIPIIIDHFEIIGGPLSEEKKKQVEIARKHFENMFKRYNIDATKLLNKN